MCVSGIVLWRQQVDPPQRTCISGDDGVQKKGERNSNVMSRATDGRKANTIPGSPQCSRRVIFLKGLLQEVWLIPQ